MNKYDQILKVIELESKNYVFNVSSYKGMELDISEFKDIIESKLIRNYILIEKILTFILYDTDETGKNVDFEVDEDGRIVFKDNQLRRKHISAVSEILNSKNFEKIPHEMQQYIQILRQYRNAVAHGAANDTLDLSLNYMESLYIFLNWFVSEYINEKSDINNKKKVLEIIVLAKRKFYVFATRLKNINNDALKMHNLSKILLEPKKDEKYIKQLEDRIAELELQLNEKTRAAQINEETIEILRRLGEQVPEILSKQDTIINKLDDLTGFVVEGQMEIQKALSEAQESKDVEEIERIINMFSDKVIFEIMRQSDADKRYDIEKKQLISIFGNKNWNKLDDNSKDFLITGKVLYSNLIDSNKVDYSGVCLLITKAVDNELHKYLYSNFKAYLRNIYHNNINDWPSFFKKTTCYGEKIISDNDFTLGSVIYFCCNNRDANQHDKEILLDYSRNALLVDTNDTESQLKFISDKSEKIRNDYRNPAAHINAINKIKADQCLDYILDTTKVLIKFMEMFK